MSQPALQPSGAHLVGSVPLANNRAVFKLTSAILGGHLRRVPDGETGVRAGWIRWQLAVFSSVTQLEPTASYGGAYGNRPLLRLRSGIKADQVLFPPLGYGAAAIESYGEFARLKRDGEVPPIRFQVSLPTPLAPVHTFIVGENGAEIEQAYEAQLLREIDGILDVIPSHELAIQWDTAVEFAVLEQSMPTYLTNPMDDILARLVRLGNRVPPDVELGYHLCYGDAGHKHFKEPDDMTKLVAVANGICAKLARPVNWVHMPVPRNRTDEAYPAPLSELKMSSDTELYLGLVHRTDGLNGARQRILAARKFRSNFGVATECGLGRRPPDTIPELLQLHAEIAVPLR
jgi:hypothetical protein